MVKLVLTYDLERYGNPSLEVTHSQNLLLTINSKKLLRLVNFIFLT